MSRARRRREEPGDDASSRVDLLFKNGAPVEKAIAEHVAKLRQRILGDRVNDGLRAHQFPLVLAQGLCRLRGGKGSTLLAQNQLP